MKWSNSYSIALLALAAESLLAWFGKPTGAASTVAGLYIASRAAQKSSHVWAASKDSNACTQEAIEAVEGRKG